MKKFTFLFVLILIFCVNGLALADEMPADMKPINLIFATYDAKTADGGVAVQRFMDNITKRTNGNVKFRAYFSAAMGGAKEIFPSISSGMVHLGYSRTMYYPGKFHLATIDELPFTGYQMDARQKAYLKLVEEFPELKAEFEKQNMKFLSPLQSNAPALASKKHITTVEGWKGEKIRGGGTGAILIKAWGGVPVSLATANIYEAIARGTVVGAFGFPPATMIAYGLHEVSDYFLDPGTGALGMLSFVMNKKAYEKLPPVVQKIFDEESAALAKTYPEVRMEGMRKKIPMALKAGAKIEKMPAATQTQLVKLGKAEMHENWIKGLVKKGYDEQQLRTMLESLLKFYDEFAPQSEFMDFWDLYEAEFKK